MYGTVITFYPTSRTKPHLMARVICTSPANPTSPCALVNQGHTHRLVIVTAHRVPTSLPHFKLSSPTAHGLGGTRITRK